MSRFHSLRAIRSYLGAQAREGEARRGKRRKKALSRFVTISREAGAGGTSVAVALAGLLNREDAEVPWTVFDKELVKEVIKQHGLPGGIERYLTEDSVPELQTIFTEFFGGVTSRRSLVTKTSATIHHLAMMGNAIIVGRAAHLVTHRLPGGRHVRLIGSPERRVERIMKITGQDRAEALKTMRSRDRGRRDYVRKYFKADLTDPAGFDMVLNTDRIPYKAAARVVMSVVTPG